MVRRFVPSLRAVVTAGAVAAAFSACADSARLVSPDASSGTRQVSATAIESGAFSSLRPLFSHTGGHETVLFAYGPSSGSNSGCWVNQTHWQHFAEDVTFSSTTSVGKIRIYGCVMPPSATPSMHIKVHADNGGAPGALVYAADVNAVWTQEAGYQVFTATLPTSFIAGAGAKFWYGLSGNGWEPGQISVRTPDDGLMAQFSGPAFTNHAGVGDMMFALLEGAPPPPPDTDGDGVLDATDNCPAASNADQADLNNDGEGDVCDSDIDGDGVANESDAFPTDSSESADSDGDGVGDNADAFPNNPNETADGDNDGVGNNGDNCPAIANSSQADQDNDGVGDACDPDIDGDGVPNASDVFPTDPLESVDSDGDGVGNNADPYDNSNTGPALMVGSCNPGVANWSVGGGTYANDLLAAAKSSASNHGGYVSAVTALSNSWKSAGLITGQQHGATVSCAARNK